MVYINRIFDIFGKTADRYDGLINSTTDMKYLLYWEIGHNPNINVVTEKMDYDMHSIITTQAVVALAKALSKLYRSTELMELADKVSGKMIDMFISQNSDVLTRNVTSNEKGVMITDGNESNFNSNPNLAKTGETEFTHITKHNVNQKRGSKNKIVPVDIDSQTEIKSPNKVSTSYGNSKGNIIMNDGIIVNPFKTKNA